METKTKTNADRIRNMTDEELAEYLSDENGVAMNPAPFPSMVVIFR